MNVKQKILDRIQCKHKWPSLKDATVEIPKYPEPYNTTMVSDDFDTLIEKINHNLDACGSDFFAIDTVGEKGDLWCEWYCKFYHGKCKG